MANSILRSQVFGAYRRLQRTTREVLTNNAEELYATENLIRDTFREAISRDNPRDYKKLLRYASQSENTLRTQVFQYQATDTPGRVRLVYRPEHVVDVRPTDFQENPPINPSAGCQQ